MLKSVKQDHQQSLFFGLSDSLDSKHPLYQLAHALDWGKFERSFQVLYSENKGAPAKPIRLMVGLLLLKHIRNLSDESVVEQWSENNYYQYFCGNEIFTPGVPCEASELVHFRHRIGVSGIELIFQESIRIHGEAGQEKEVIADTTVQEKNITFPTDAKLHRKIIDKCQQIAKKEKIKLRQNYKRTLKKLAVDQRFRHHPKNRQKARKADRKVRTIAGRFVRELDRKLPALHLKRSDLQLYYRILAQKKQDRHKIYSLHEPEVECISKGKEHKKYEFGNKVSILYTQSTGIIVGALSFRNPYDGHTLPSVLDQHERLTGQRATRVTCDRGYRGEKAIGTTSVQIPKPFNDKILSKHRQRKLRKAFRRRAAIEPIIGHLKTDHRLNRNFYKGIFGDEINVLLAAAAFNFRKKMNKWKELFSFGLEYFFRLGMIFFFSLNPIKRKSIF
jgi:IS5 family transposase